MHIAWWDTHPLWTEGMTNACENITLPQTSFASGNKGGISTFRMTLKRARTKFSRAKLIPLILHCTTNLCRQNL